MQIYSTVRILKEYLISEEILLMIMAENSEAIQQAHEVSVKMAEIEKIAEGKIDSHDRYPDHLHRLHLLARNAIFEELASGRIISGESVVEGAESLLYALGQDAKTAEVSASRLAPAVEARSSDPEVVLARNHYMGRVSDVGILASDSYRDGSIYLRAESFAQEPNIFNGGIAKLVIPFSSDYFLGHNDGNWYFDVSGDDQSVSIGIKDFARHEGPAIFDDPEEALMFGEKNEHATCLLIGSEAVLSALDEMDGQSAVAAKNMLEARIKGEERPSVDNINLSLAAGSGMKKIVESEHKPYMPAESHPSILEQLSQKDLLTAAHAAINGMSKEEFAKSGRLDGLRLNRQLKASIVRVAGNVVADFLDRSKAGAVTEEQRQSLEDDVITAYALSLDEHLSHNRRYKYAVKPFGPAMQRRNVSRVMEEYQVS